MCQIASFGVFLLENAVRPFKLYRHGASQVSTKKRDLAFFWWICRIFAWLSSKKLDGWYICTQVEIIKKKKKLINPRRACAARVIVVVLSVCLSVCPRAISLHEPSPAPQTMPRIQRPRKVEKYVGFSLKQLCPGVTAWKPSERANMHNY